MRFPPHQSPSHPTRRTGWPMAACAGVAILAAGPAHAARLAFVLNSADATIDEYDIDSHQQVRRVSVLREPHHTAPTPDGKYLLVGDTSGNMLFFLDAVTGERVRQIPMADPYQLQFSPNGKYFTIAGLARNQVDIYDASDYHLLYRLHVDAMPSHMNYAPDSSVVYVSLQDSGKLTAIETATGKVLWTSDVGSTPAGVLWHNDQILVGVMGTNYVAVVDPADGHVERKIEMAPGPHNLFVSPDNKRLFVTCRASGIIERLDWDSLNVVQSYHVAGGPDDIVFAPDGKMWATLRWRQHVAIIDPTSGEVVDTIRTGRSPHGIWLNTNEPTLHLSMADRPALPTP
ncbi:PQQ-binding-like beta-propeller repeat protein [Gluconacetobacter azotocaptans]|uniref:PQQ-binding-like beta-propeller repeat protein n=2 Tax=Gluconacetobacter azotocaptans TaxID=142834 RepID=A0A7W4PES5_9PROT|nr:PQQ-binding-like beta-propeller repeat protein [Gluconacetobacter azotocaptans]MBB2191068.1 PQQ-binding-like beta-propeller repeat protein [Gluconacetobacter azotocaptans]MBM9403510.1 PQQ-binding-like beta-propeller repeat protein [Gluconacetobacter azotocaptans]